MPMISISSSCIDLAHDRHHGVPMSRPTIMFLSLRLTIKPCPAAPAAHWLPVRLFLPAHGESVRISIDRSGRRCVSAARRG